MEYDNKLLITFLRNIIKLFVNYNHRHRTKLADIIEGQRKFYIKPAILFTYIKVFLTMNRILIHIVVAINTRTHFFNSYVLVKQ